MTAGYVVSDSPDGPAQTPGTPTHPGTGQAAATIWLNRLRALAHRTCVAPLPYAQADLDALQRVNDPGLSTIATNSAGDIVDRILDVPSTRGATLLPDGPLTNRAVNLLSADDSTVAIAAADFSAQDAASGAPTNADIAPRRLSPQVVARAVRPGRRRRAGRGRKQPHRALPIWTPRCPFGSPMTRPPRAARTRWAPCSGAAWQPDAAPRTQILVPAGDVEPAGDDAQFILTALATTIRSGLAVPRPLPAVIADAAAHTDPPEPPGAYASARGRFNDDITAQIAGQVGRLWKLTSALITDDRTGLTGVQYTAPLREDMLRALSQSEPPDTRNGLAQQRLAVVGNTINDLFGAVTIVNPGGSYTLATEHSPLPLALHNGLAVPIRVELQVDAPPGMTVTDVGADRTAAGIPAAAGTDRSELHPAGRHRRGAADAGRHAAGRAGAVVGALQRLRQGAVRDHADRGGDAGDAGRTAALAPLPRPARPRRPRPPRPARRTDAARRGPIRPSGR